jgi:heavy metal sensor kinase
MSFGKAKRKGPVNTIGLRLTLWGAGATLAVCLLLCGILYAGLSYSLHHEVDGFLEGEIQEFAAILREHGDDYKAAEKSIRLELGGRSRGDLSFRLLDKDGHVLLCSSPEDRAGTLWMPPPAWNATQTKNFFHTVDSPGNPYPVRLCSQRLVGPDGQIRIAQAGYLLDRLSRSLATFRYICLIALLGAGAVAVLGGRLLANRSLRPIQAMSAKARRINAQNLEERIPEAHTGDELDQLAGTLNAMLDRIQRYVTRLQQFTADASHEFRSPLAALRGNAEVALTRNRSTEELRHVIEESIEQYDRLGRIADDLLLLAQADAGHFHLRRERMRLDQAIADVLDLYSPLAAECGIELTFAEQHETWLEGDASRLRQLVGNLIDNAIKYTQAPGRVTVSIGEAAGAAYVTVADTGAGIAPEHLTRVFDRFYRVDRSRSVKCGGGAGLGLAICRMIAETHGGRLELASTPGAGTTVTLTLPSSPKCCTPAAGQVPSQ